MNRSEWCRLADALRGRYISIEGGEGAGKTENARWLTDQLAEIIGHDVVLIREPGGTEVGEQIRNVLLHTGGAMHTMAEMLLFFAARAELLHRVIIPALKDKKIVVSDRCLFSSIAYQACGGRTNGGDIDPEDVLRLAEQVLPPVHSYGKRDVPYPHLTVVLRSDIETMRARAGESLDRIESRDVLYHEAVFDGYERLQRILPRCVESVDATVDLTVVRNQLIGVLVDHFVPRAR
jgi:dTMP kinase